MVTLNTLSYKLLEKIDAWRVIEETIEEPDVSLEPAIRDSSGFVDIVNGEVWCLCNAIFNDGEIYKATALCRGDSDFGPVLISVRNGEENISLIMPPAPVFILDLEGPEIFCEKFRKNIDDVFPMVFQVIPCFKMKPQVRYITIVYP